MPNDPRLWVEDPPASSWPACLAVKAAALQSSAAGDRFLRRLREAVMIEGRNIARQDVLMELAREVGYLDAGRLERDLAAAAPAALEEDVREARFRGIGRYPCLMLRRAGRAPAYLVGWRPYPALVQAVAAFAPELGPERPLADADAYRRYWGGALAAEAAQALADGMPADGTPADVSPGPLSSGSGS
jgi:predicted DsbA family dithiol-disulfide isomerase